MRSYAVVKDDPLVLLHIGLTYLHIAMQRLSNNRQLQVLRGMSFVYKYYEKRRKGGSLESVEAEYNIGRAFHQLGMNSYRKS